MARIEAQNLNVLYKHFGKDSTQALNNLNAVFDDGKINVIIGESGCGKTTLLRAILGIEKHGGTLLVDGNDLSVALPNDRNFAYVNQNISVYPHMNIFNNIAYPLKVIHTPADEIRRRVFEIADYFGITNLLFRKPRELSLGQNQRVAIAKAMIRRPEAYLFDEPFSNLDEKTSDEIRLFIKKIFKERRATVIFVTHNFLEATRLADKIFVMEKGEIIYSGSPREIIKTADERVRKYFKQ